MSFKSLPVLLSTFFYQYHSPLHSFVWFINPPEKEKYIFYIGILLKDREEQWERGGKKTVKLVSAWIDKGIKENNEEILSEAINLFHFKFLSVALLYCMQICHYQLRVLLFIGASFLRCIDRWGGSQFGMVFAGIVFYWIKIIFNDFLKFEIIQICSQLQVIEFKLILSVKFFNSEFL